MLCGVGCPWGSYGLGAFTVARVLDWVDGAGWALKPHGPVQIPTLSPPSGACWVCDIATQSPMGWPNSLTKLASAQSMGTIFVTCEK